jgi:hypothetical protein
MTVLCFRQSSSIIFVPWYSRCTLMSLNYGRTRNSNTNLTAKALAISLTKL